MHRMGVGVEKGLQKQPRAASTDAEVAQLAATAHRSNNLSGAAANEHILWRMSINRCRTEETDTKSLQNVAKRP